MAISSLSLSLASTTLSNGINVPRPSAFSSHNIVTCSRDKTFNEERSCNRRPLLFGVGALALSLFPANSIFAEEMPKNYAAFVDSSDGYSYYYPSDWREFDFRGHDSAFKDRYLQLQNVRLSFLPTDKKDIHDLGPMEEVVLNLVRHIYSAPTQRATVFDMQEKTIDGKNYYTFEYVLTSPNFARAAFATIAIGNGRYYTLIVGANERRWRRVRNKLKVVADSFKVLDI
ncbi:photosynthetic NDH subunit of lumenal location 1, chloroplastic isoform X2 [Cornus florida]|uniref:photosynthetic NDH subunit of lumenal location 1, chloroplastic isoform X2 n=1 Tax=Cornus florida TaxID=4283 RepID=UPI0028980D71|nr:photosynthetic NDH subunit of lumenal location 1, chloroplastic isoform X2 [Cornus florida]